MDTSVQSKIKNWVMECLADGREHSTGEMKEYLANHGLVIESGSSALRNVLYTLRKDGKLTSLEKGMYRRSDVEPAIEEMSLAQKYHFEEYDVIREDLSNKSKYKVTVAEDGTFTVSAGLLKCFPQKRAVIRLHKDGKSMLLVAEGEGQLSLNRNGRSKKPEVTRRLKELKYIFPMVYEGEWIEADKIWVGKAAKRIPQPGKH